MLLRAGWNAKQIQVWLGHHSPAFTLTVYVHLLSDDLPDPSFLDDLGTNQVVTASAAQVAVEADNTVTAAEKGGNVSATQPTETGRTEGDVETPETARILGAVRVA
jgi:hypothetical protein